MPSARRLVCSPWASTWLGRASGYGCHTITAMAVIRSQDPAGSADADINININIHYNDPGVALEGEGDPP